MAQLNDFIGQIKGEGLMRNNRYVIVMPLPKGLAGTYNTGQMQKVLLFCDSISVPGVTISTMPARTYGEIREMPWEKIYSPANLSFYVDNSMEVKKLFDQWQGIIQSPTTRNMGYYDDYKTTITITIVDVFNNSRYDVTLHEAYLKDIGAIQMDASNRDVMKLNVTIQYKYWTSTDANSSVAYPDNRGFFEKLFGGFLGDTFDTPSKYFSDFTGFQSGFNNVTPNLGGLSLPGASYKF